MANKYDDLRKQFNTKGVYRDILRGTKKALNKASRATRTHVRRELRKSLGLPSKRINKRVLSNKPEKGLTGRHSLKTSVAVATQRFMPMRYFKPKQKIVRTRMQGVRRKVRRYGATIKIGRNPRRLVAGAFLMDVGHTKIVAKRKTEQRKPTEQLYTKALQKELDQRGNEFNKRLNKEFEKVVQTEIDLAVQKNLRKTNS